MKVGFICNLFIRWSVSCLIYKSLTPEQLILGFVTMTVIVLASFCLFYLFKDKS